MRLAVWRTCGLAALVALTTGAGAGPDDGERGSSTGGYNASRAVVHSPGEVNVAFVDARMDTPFALIDMTDLRLKLTRTEITAEITVVKLPELIDYNDPDTPDNCPEFDWHVWFDASGDVRFSDGDLELAVLYIKFPGAKPATGAILDITQHDLWEFEGESQIRTVAKIDASIHRNTLTMNVPRSAHPALESIDHETAVRFGTSHYHEGVLHTDSFPDYGTW